MREIKFRAWDKGAKKFMWPWPEGFYILGETTCFDLIGQQLKKRSPEKNTLEMLNDVEIMQYTGLHDKNDKEIYEGDILEGRPCGRYHKILVEYIEWRFTARCFWVGAQDIPNEPFSEYKEWAIIGNRFENPELPSKNETLRSELGTMDIDTTPEELQRLREE